MSDEENPKVNQSQEEEEPQKCNKLGIAAFLVIFLIILIVGGVLNSQSKEEAKDSKPESESSVSALSGHYFNRVSTFPVCMQLDDNCNVDDETVAEIVAASDDGNKVVYTDGKLKSIGFIDITDAADPKKDGLVDVGGECTSLVVLGKYVVVGVNLSNNFTNPSGTATVVDTESKEIVHTMDLGGQPDSLSISPDKKFIAIAIENERDEDFNDGQIPQLPAGFLQIIDSSDEDPTKWTVTKVELTGLAGVKFPTDPEPEFVAINEDNIAAVSLQENNAIVLVDLAEAKVIKSFSAGEATVDNVDTKDDGIIDQNGSVTVPREPDGIAWIGNDYIATADEGDLDGGSRGFTIFDKEGTVVYENGNEIEEWTIRTGHFPDGRAGKKGNEPENVHYAEFDSNKILFVGSERSSLVFVYDVLDPEKPVLHQILPTAVKPEGKFAIPSRNLLLVASEEDARGDKMRSAVNIYELQEGDTPVYPSLISGDRADGKPIPFSALSGLAFKDGMVYSVEDSAFEKSRMFGIDVSSYPYKVSEEVQIKDTNDKLAAILSVNASAIILNGDTDKTVNLDLEGIDAVEDGFWIVSEGRGTAGDAARPFETPNLLIKVNAAGEIQEAVTTPQSLTDVQLRFGFEGVAVDGDNVVVAFQRAWAGDTNPRLGVYSIASNAWIKFVYYPLDDAMSANGGWVGLSDLHALGNGKFYVLERDNQFGPDGVIKKIYEIDLGDYSLADASTVGKTLVRDLVPDLNKATNGMLMEKIEGLTMDGDGNVWINNDNDGVDDNSGEQLLLKIEM